MNAQPSPDTLRLATHIVEHALSWEYKAINGSEWVLAKPEDSLLGVLAEGYLVRLADGWLPHYGGECPVEPESIPTVLFYSGETQEEVRAKGYIWGWTRPENAAIIAYKPDPYGKFRQALADGKKVQLIDSERGFDLSEPTFSEPPDQYRIVPEKKRVKLGPEDVPPGSVIRWKMPKQFGWVAVEYVCAEGLWLPVGDVAKYFKWDRLAEHCEINRSIPLTGKWDASAWEPCYKEVPVT